MECLLNDVDVACSGDAQRLWHIHCVAQLAVERKDGDESAIVAHCGDVVDNLIAAGKDGIVGDISFHERGYLMGGLGTRSPLGALPRLSD